MSENPYESPQSASQPRESTSIGSSAHIAIPSAGTIGVVVCYATFTFAMAMKPPHQFIVAVPILTYLVILGTLIVFKQFIGGGRARGERVNFFLAGVGTMLTTPVAVIVGGYFILEYILPAPNARDMNHFIKAWAGVWIACCIWATGMWVGMNIPAKTL